MRRRMTVRSNCLLGDISTDLNVGFGFDQLRQQFLNHSGVKVHFIPIEVVRSLEPKNTSLCIKRDHGLSKGP